MGYGENNPVIDSRVGVKVANAFSLAMVNGDCDVEIRQVSIDKLKRDYRLETSCVGHEGAAEYYTQLLGWAIPVNRVNLSLSAGDRLLVGQICGRLPEGKVLEAVDMPPVKWLLVTVKSPMQPQISQLRVELDEAYEAYAELKSQIPELPEPQENICQKCGKRINPVAFLFGVGSDDPNECHC